MSDGIISRTKVLMFQQSNEIIDIERPHHKGKGKSHRYSKRKCKIFSTTWLFLLLLHFQFITTGGHPHTHGWSQVRLSEFRLTQSSVNDSEDRYAVLWTEQAKYYLQEIYNMDSKDIQTD